MADIPADRWRTPLKQSEKIDKIYFAIFGVNGDDGMLAMGKKRDAKIAELCATWRDFVANRGKTCPVNTNAEAIKQKRWAIIKFVISLAGWATLITKLLGWW